MDLSENRVSLDPLVHHHFSMKVASWEVKFSMFNHFQTSPNCDSAFLYAPISIGSPRDVPVPWPNVLQTSDRFSSVQNVSHCKS